MGAPYTGKSLYAKFGDTVLSGRYKTFSETDEVGLLDKTCYADVMRNWVVAPNEGSLTIEVLQEAGGTAAWGALEPGAEGTLEWTPEGTGATYSIEARVKNRKRSVVADDVVKLLFEFVYSGGSSESVSLTGAGAITFAGLTLSAAGTVTGAGWRIGSASITFAGLTLVGAGAVSGGTTPPTGGGSPIGLLLALTYASSGASEISGEAAIAFSGLTLAAVGKAAVNGSAAFTLAGMTLAGTGTVAVKGSASITLAGVTLSAAGEVETPVTTQYARPDSDVTTTGWSSTPLYAKIDEESADDGDYITSGKGSATYTCEVGLSNVSDPGIGTGHIVNWRARYGGSGSNTVKTRLYLYQGSTLIATTGQATETSSFAAHTYTLSEAEANAITDYTDLRFRIEAVVSGSGSRNGQVSRAELETPAA